MIMTWISLIAICIVASIGAFIGAMFASYLLLGFLREWALNFSEMLRQEEKKSDKP